MQSNAYKEKEMAGKPVPGTETAGFGGQNHVVLSQIKRTYVNIFCFDFQRVKQWLMRFYATSDADFEVGL